MCLWEQDEFQKETNQILIYITYTFLARTIMAGLLKH